MLASYKHYDITLHPGYIRLKVKGSTLYQDIIFTSVSTHADAITLAKTWIDHWVSHV